MANTTKIKMQQPITFRDTESGAKRTLDLKSKRDKALIMKMRTLKKIVPDPEGSGKLIELGLRWEQVNGPSMSPAEQKAASKPKAAPVDEAPGSDVDLDDLQDD